ncbi:MAG: hypothetical protein ABI833_05885 [Acidobacteriota bacterium]
MDTRTQDPAGYYVWEVPGQAVVVHLRLEVVDRLAAEVVRGFGSVPKRGAEVGGFLIGTIQPGVPAIARIDDFEPVACEYRRGPSYLFTEEDVMALDDSRRRLQPAASPSAYAVGYFRSNTRDGFSLEPEDLEILDRFLPGPAHVALLIKPYATKVSVGGFFIREHGEFPQASPLEFPLRRRELLGEESAPRRSLAEGHGERAARTASATQVAFGFTGSEPALPLDTEPAPPKSRLRTGWVWFPLIFLFMLLGVGLGYELSLTLGARAAANAVQDFSLSLSVQKSGDNLKVSWSRRSPAVRYAQRGLLEIDDGGYTRPVALDAAQLQNGTLIYRNVSNAVRFRMTVFPQARVSVVETLEWKQ